MKNSVIDYIDFSKVNSLLEGFHRTTGFVTAILDLNGNILSRSGWRQICTEFHRKNPATVSRCMISDTVLANKTGTGEKYHFYKCMNGLVDVAVPVVIRGEHVANLFSGQFFLEKPDIDFFRKQARENGFDEKEYLEALSRVPIVTIDRVRDAVDFLIDMTQLISETTFQKLEQAELNRTLQATEERFRRIFENNVAVMLLIDPESHRIIDANLAAETFYGWRREQLREMTVNQINTLPVSEISIELEKARSRKSMYFNFRHRKADGSVADVEVYSSKVEIDGKEYLHSIIYDITDRIIAEKRLRENDTLIRIAAEKARLGGWTVDLKENRTYWSHIVAAIHEMPPGYSPPVEAWIKFYTPEWRDRITKVFDDCARKGIPYDEEMEIFTSTGKRVWIRTVGEAVRDEDGKIVKVQGAFQDISEKKIVETKSREKDMQFRKLSANVPDLIFQFTRKPDGSYCVPVASDGIRNIFGCSPEEVVEDFAPIARVIHPDDTERVIADIEYSARHLTYFTCEFRVQIPGKPVQWIFSRSNPEKLPDGSTTWYGFNADITRRKEMEDALRESESKFRKIYEDGPFGMSLVNRDYKFIMVNRTFCEITGYQESKLKDLTFRDITFPDDIDAGMDRIEQLIKGEIPVVRLEKRYVRKDGQVIWGSITVTANFDKNGKFLYNLSITEDITQRKEADEEIKLLNERLHLLVVAIQQLSVSISMENIMQTVRSSARKLVNADGATFVLRDGGYSFYADEDSIMPLWKGQRFPLTDCISGWAMINKQSVVIKDIHADDRIPIELYNSTFVRSLAVTPINHNNPLGAIGAYWAREYSPSEMEIQLLQTLADAAAKAVENVQLIDGLEKRITERTFQLQSVNSELESFSYSVSHDLRAPLRHINGFADILMKQYSDKIPDDALKHLDTIVASAKKMGTLIDDLLSFSRTGRIELKKAEFNMSQVVDDALTQIKPSIRDRKIKWEIASLPVIQGDYNLLSLVWSNLIDNAVKYTRSKKLAIISIGYTEDEDEVTFFIRDNGVGFDMKYSDKLFGVFQRLHSSSQFEGTGIGLANVQRIILRHGGKTRAEAEPEKGATFYFSIPKKK
jgi:PAS domain S-box-containing protein